MSDTPASPRASRLPTPGWLDGRLVLGVLLVLVSVVVGARTLSAADRSALVWAATTDLTAGSQLTRGDLEPVRVRLFESGGRYLRADSEPPVGYVVRRGIGNGELLPRDALGTPQADVDYRLVTVPVETGHYPPTLQDDQRVDLWVTPQLDPGPAAGAAPGTATPSPERADQGAALALQGAQQVLTSVVVVHGPSRDDLAVGGSTVPVVLQVRPDQVEDVVSAMGLGRLDLVRVPRQAEADGRLGAPVEAG